MTDSHARATICIPSHRPSLLAEAIASVHAQTMSTNLLVSCASAWWDEKLNDLIAAVRTEFVAVLCDDDHLAPTFVEEAVRAADAHGADLVFTDYEYFGSVSDIKSAGPFGVGPLRESNTLLGWTALIRTQTLRAAGGFDSSFAYQDWECWLRLARAGVSAYHLRRALVRYRKWDGCGGYAINYADAKHAVLARHGYA